MGETDGVKVIEGADSLSGWTAPKGRPQEDKAMPKKIVVGYLGTRVERFDPGRGMRVLVLVFAHGSYVGRLPLEEANRLRSFRCGRRFRVILLA